MSKTIIPQLDDDLFPILDEPEDFADRFADLMAKSDEAFMNEVNRESQEFMADLAREHDRDIEAYIAKLREKQEEPEAELYRPQEEPKNHHDKRKG